MRTSFHSRTATKVKDGRVQRKNRSGPSGLHGYVLDRRSPGRGFRHPATKQDVQTFIDLIPDWEKYSQRLTRIVLDRGHGFSGGACAFYHREETGTIFLDAWNEDLWMSMDTSFLNNHQHLLDRLEISHDRREEDAMARFTAAQARAFTLLHVFMHELGHHYDALRQKHRVDQRDENYAERFANSRFEELFPKYVAVFGDPRREPSK